MKVLIAEDDEQIANILNLYLRKEGYHVDVVSNGQEVLSYFECQSADVLILDWMMPKLDGISVCKELRTLQTPIKILMLTAKATVQNELEGLTLGADDYLRKPFDMKVLLLRIKKLCPFENNIKYKDILVNTSSKNVFKNDNFIKLTKKEYELLIYIIKNQNTILSREMILNAVWGIDYVGDYRTVDTHVRRLRKKIGAQYIKTRVGMGYYMEKQDE